MVLISKSLLYNIQQTHPPHRIVENLGFFGKGAMVERVWRSCIRFKKWSEVSKPGKDAIWLSPNKKASWYAFIGRGKRSDLRPYQKSKRNRGSDFLPGWTKEKCKDRIPHHPLHQQGGRIEKQFVSAGTEICEENDKPIVRLLYLFSMPELRYAEEAIRESDNGLWCGCLWMGARYRR